MSDPIARVLTITIFGLCLLVIAMGVRIEALQYDLERLDQTPTKSIPTISDSLSIGRDSSLEGLR
jgi:hypothetical protein